MAAEIKINDTLVNDQSSGVTDDDTLIGTDPDAPDLTGLSTAFTDFLKDSNLTALKANILSGTQLAFADDVEAAVSSAGYVTVTPNGSNVSDLFFSDADGKALEGEPVALQTVDGDDIFLWSFGDFVLATTDDDPDAKGDVVAAFYLNETKDHLSASIEMVTFIPIAHPDDTDPDDQIDWTDVLNVSAATSVDFSFAGAPSGDNLFMTFGDPNTTQIVVIGQNPLNQSEGGNITTKDVLNISKAGSTTSFGVNGNAINPGEGAFITFVTGADKDLIAPNLDQNEADLEENIKFTGTFNTTGASFTVNQTNPGVGPVSIKITALTDPDEDADGNSVQESGTKFVDGLADDTKVFITSVSVVDNVVKTGSSVFVPTIKDNGDGTWTISGLSTGDKISWTTTDTHNRILIQNISGKEDGISGNDNNTLDIGGFSLTKGDVVTESVGDTLFVDDDGPTTDLELKSAELRLDESVGTDANDANADDETTKGAATGAIGFDTIAGKDLFTETTDFGTDGAAASDSKLFELTLSASGADSGLKDTASGEAVVLTLVNGVIEGRTDTGDDLVLTISVDKTNGDVTVNQFRAVVHGDATDPDEADTPESIDKDVVGLKLTVTDGDGDTDDDSVDLGPIIKLEDDGPTADLALKEGAELRLDESVGTDANDANADDEMTKGAAAGAIGFDTIAAADLFDKATADFGSDGAAASDSKLFELTLSVSGADSGLKDTASGETVVLTLVNGVIEGRTDTGDDLVLTIEVDKTNGDVTVNQFRAVVHGDATDPDEADTPESIDKDVVGLKLTVTDGDKDTANDSVDLGPIIKLEDDGPTADLALKEGAELRLDESVGTDANDANADDETTKGAAVGAIGFDTIAAADLFDKATADFGSDGAAASDSKVFELTLSVSGADSGLKDTASGEAVVLTLVNGVIEGRTETGDDLVLTISVDKTAGDVTVNQFRAVVHGDATDPDEADTPESIDKDVVGLKLTVTDGDGDTDDDSIDLGPTIKLEDDGPTITVDDSLKGTFKLGAQGTWDHDPGSDGFESLTMTLDSYKIGAGSTVTTDTALTGTVDKDGNFVFTGSIEDDFNGDKTKETVTFTLTLDPDNPETYDLQLTTPPGGTKTFDTSQGSLKAGGPDAVQTLQFPPAGHDGDVVFFAVAPTVPLENGSVGKDPNDIEDLVKNDPDEATLQTTNGGLITLSTQLNVSTSGIGVNNNNLDSSDDKGQTTVFQGTSITSKDESFVVNPEDDVDTVRVFIDNSVGGYTPATEDLYYVAYFTDGTVSGPTKVLASDLDPVSKSDPISKGTVFEIESGAKDIEAVQLIMGKGTVKIPVIQFVIETEFNPSAIDLNFTADLFDGDGDHQEDSFSVHLDPATV
jgi:hypothetical protein